MTKSTDSDLPEVSSQASEDHPEYDPLDRPPVEVFRAVEGERRQLADYLRRSRPVSYYTLEAIAAWMAGELPPSRAPGNPHGSPLQRTSRRVAFKLAKLVYKSEFARAGRPSGRSGEIADAVAEQLGLDPVTFQNHLRRSKKQKKHKPVPEMTHMEEMWWEWKSRQ